MNEQLFIEYSGNKCRALNQGETLQCGDVFRGDNGRIEPLNAALAGNVVRVATSEAFPEGYYFRPVSPLMEQMMGRAVRQ